VGVELEAKVSTFMPDKVSATDSLPIAEFASLFGFPPEAIIRAIEVQRHRRADGQAYFTIPQLAERWSCSRAQVYALLRATAAKVLDIGEGSKRSKTLVPADAVERLEKARMGKMG
jgi:hypothetical protein